MTTERSAYALRDGRLYTARRPSRARAIAGLVGTFGLVGVIVGQAVVVMPWIEESLTRSTEQALSTAGFPEARVRMAGRDVTISGVPATDSSEVAEIARQVPGVYRVARIEVLGDIAATQADGGAAPGASPSVPVGTAATQPIDLSGVRADELARVAAVLDAGQVHLFGAVPSSAAAKALLSTLHGVFGPENVRDNLIVDSTAGGQGLTGVGPLITALGTRTTSGVVSLRAGRLNVVGTVPEDLETVEEEIRGLAVACVGDSPTAVAIDLSNNPDGGAPEDAAQAQDAARMLTALPSIRFGSGSAEIDPESEPVLDVAADLLTTFPELRVKIEGSTDATGEAAANLELSADRAWAVRNGLLNRGAKRAQIDTQGFGETRPLVGPDSPLPQDVIDDLNRRVTFVGSLG